jgi:hypothetical protein
MPPPNEGRGSAQGTDGAGVEHQRQGLETRRVSSPRYVFYYYYEPGMFTITLLCLY